MPAPRESTPSVAIEHRFGAIVSVVDVVVDPRAAFGAIARRPTWLVGLIAVVCVRFLSLFVFYRPDATPLKLVTGIAFQAATITPMLLASAALLWATSRAWTVPLRWCTALSIVIHVVFAYTVATIAAASFAGAVLPPSVEVDLREPPFVNLGHLIDGQNSPVSTRALAELDIRSAYAAVLVATGLRAAHPTVSQVRVVGTVVSCFLVRLVAVLSAATS